MFKPLNLSLDYFFLPNELARVVVIVKISLLHGIILSRVGVL